MPTKFGFEVSVVQGDDDVVLDDLREAYIEYGTTTMRLTGSTQQTITTKIESKTDATFFIRIRPVGPFPLGPLSQPWGYISAESREQRMAPIRDFPSLLQGPNRATEEVCPYGAGICIYIDGQSRSEQDSVLDTLKPNSHRYAYVRGRTVVVGKDTNGIPIVETRGWKFSELGIEVQMNNLTITDDSTSTSASRNCDKVGQIEVCIDRCVAEGWCSTLSEELIGTSEVATNQDHKLDATHEMQLANAATSERLYKSKKTRQYIAGEDVYATFIFQYMSRDKLVKLGVCDENGKEVIKQQIPGSSGAVTTVGDTLNIAETEKRKAAEESSTQFTMTLRPKRGKLSK